MSKGMIMLTVVILAATLSGCAVIGDFKGANEKVLTCPTLEDVMIVPSADGSQQKHFVLKYTTSFRKTWGPVYDTRHVAIPLINDLAPEPLNFRGPLHKENEFSPQNDIPIAQRMALLKYRFSDQSMRLGENYQQKFKSSKSQLNKTMLNTRESGIYSGFDGMVSFYDISTESMRGENTEFTMIPYWTSEPFLDKAVIGESQYGYFRGYSLHTLYESPPKLAFPYNILIVPTEILRPQSDQQAARRWAMIKAPVNLCIDIVTPLAFVFYALPLNIIMGNAKY